MHAGSPSDCQERLSLTARRSCQVSLAKHDSIFIGLTRRDADMETDPQVGA